jgi:hypothetical protein
MPDDLFRRAKKSAAERKTTLRMLGVDAVDRSLSEQPVDFRLRDASVGGGAPTVGSEAINQAVDAQREPPFTP